MKTVKHLNVMHPNPGIDQVGYDYFYFVCRGCTMRNRQSILQNTKKREDSRPLFLYAKNGIQCTT